MTLITKKRTIPLKLLLQRKKKTTNLTMNQSTLNNSIKIPLQAQDYENKINNYILNTTPRKDLRKEKLRITTTMNKRKIN